MTYQQALNLLPPQYSLSYSSASFSEHLIEVQIDRTQINLSLLSPKNKVIYIQSYVYPILQTSQIQLNNIKDFLLQEIVEIILKFGIPCETN